MKWTSLLAVEKTIYHCLLVQTRRVKTEHFFGTFWASLPCFPSQAAGGGGGQEDAAGASPPAAAEGAVSNRGREAGAGGRAEGQGERAADGHAAAGQAGEGTAGGAGAV